MVPMIDFLMVTISFLLLTAVWTHTARLDGTTRVPGPPDPINKPIEPMLRMHVQVPPGDAPLALSLRRGNELLEARTVSRRELSARLDDMRRAHAPDFASEESRVVVMHADNQIPYRDMIAVMDSISKDARFRVNLATK